MDRISWFKFVIQYSRPWMLPFQILYFIKFETYYQLCKLLGYPPRHFLDPLPEEIRNIRAGDRILLTWPQLPLYVRLLDWIFYSIGHADFALYTREAEKAAKASGRRTEIIPVKRGELRVGYSR